VFKDLEAVFRGWRWRPAFPAHVGRMKPVVDGYIVVSLERQRMRCGSWPEKARIISEGAGALPLAAALTGKAGRVRLSRSSLANIDLKKFSELIEASAGCSVEGEIVAAFAAGDASEEGSLAFTETPYKSNFGPSLVRPPAAARKPRTKIAHDLKARQSAQYRHPW